MKLRKFTEQQLRDAVVGSVSIREVLEKLSVVAAGGNYKTIQKAIQEFQIDTSHLLGRASNRGKKFGSRRDIQEYLSNNMTIQSYKLKNRLLKEGLLERKCNCCNNTEWLNEPIALELHHKDGNHLNNELNNLELLCPNCHAFTDNYRGKNTPKI